ncbi:uncharacterized protein KGF55_001240 [Candida pseudojiufengensis]|uniref:uncharacterized protein n=1 Tax=Candida pseudojiufengensis TaxID=497109 RepID=UPI00222487A3|nr:uncharacterized protein KGF55_001240 [Candida pseudojiufengensis]KAI5965876.1 hypothetical protein KGF55_001240 [Candida pseudojiufengensis]
MRSSSLFTSFLFSLQVYAQIKTLNLFARVLDDANELSSKFADAPIYIDLDTPGSKLLEVEPNDGSSKRKRAQNEFEFEFDEELQDVFKLVSDQERLELNAEGEILQMTSFVKPLITYLIDLKSGLLEKLLQFLGISGLNIVENLKAGSEPAYNVVTNKLQVIGKKSIPIDIVARQKVDPKTTFKIK